LGKSVRTDILSMILSISLWSRWVVVELEYSLLVTGKGKVRVRLSGHLVPQARL